MGWCCGFDADANAVHLTYDLIARERHFSCVIEPITIALGFMEVEMESVNWSGPGRGLAVVAAMVFLLSAISAETSDDNEPENSSPAIEATYAEINADFQRLQPIFHDGCFDCHSNQTDYPWYHSLPFVKGFLDGHIAEAREELDMSNGFPFGGHSRRQADNLFKIKRELEEGNMPLLSYRIMHWGAAPNAEEKDSIYAFVDRSLILLAAHGQYPFNRRENVPGME